MNFLSLISVSTFLFTTNIPAEVMMKMETLETADKYQL